MSNSNTSTQRRIRPLDTVLFKGSDAVASFIAKVEASQVVPHLPNDSKWHGLWTHAGIIVDKNVLPLDCLEPNRIYILESIFSGQIMNFTYSKVLPVDHIIKGGFHLGPQIRDLWQVIDEAKADVGIFQLDPSERERLLGPYGIQETRRRLLAFHREYHSYSYPLNPVPQLAAASPALYKNIKLMKDSFDAFQKSNASASNEDKKKKVFCSELVALLYRALEVPGFSKFSSSTSVPSFSSSSSITLASSSRNTSVTSMQIDPAEFTPLELQVMDVFRNQKCVHIKVAGVNLLNPYDLTPQGMAVNEMR